MDETIYDNIRCSYKYDYFFSGCPSFYVTTRGMLNCSFCRIQTILNKLTFSLIYFTLLTLVLMCDAPVVTFDPCHESTQYSICKWFIIDFQISIVARKVTLNSRSSGTGVKRIFLALAGSAKPTFYIAPVINGVTDVISLNKIAIRMLKLLP